MMTKKEFEIILKAHEILNKLTDDQTIESVDEYYWHRLRETDDCMGMLVHHIKDNRKKLLKD